MIGATQEMQATAIAAGSVRPTKLFIGGITRNTTTKQLRDHFEKYGRVLDCVAMRLPDGKPRGFGYVTVDSSKAADACLAVPQVIDGRVVDLKRAVPEGSMDMAPTTRLHTPSGKRGSPTMFPAQAYESQAAAWQNVLATDPVSADYAYGALLGTSAPMMPASPAWPTSPYGMASPDCVELLSTGRSMMFYPPETPASNGLSADAAEFVPLSAEAAEFVPQLASEPVKDDETETPEAELVEPEQKEAEPKKRMALGEITNTVRNSDKAADKTAEKTADKSMLMMSPQKVALPAESAMAAKSLNSSSLYPSRNPGLQIRTDDIFQDQPFQIHTDDMFQDPPSTASAAQPEAEASPKSEDDEEESDMEDMPVSPLGPLPSAGSVEHAEGTCKRCNFFAKGRCGNGQDCSFCHYPHEKKKVSRQEKRERKADWMSTLMKCAGAQIVETENVQVAYPAVYGFPGVADCAAPLLSTTVSPSAASQLLAAPPGLIMHDIHWQPDAESSPAVAQPAKMPLLSTTPVSASAVLQQPMTQMFYPKETTEEVAKASSDAKYSREQLLRCRMALSDKSEGGLRTVSTAEIASK